MNEDGFLSTLERYDEIINSWNEMTMFLPMPAGRGWDPGVVTNVPLGGPMTNL